jgi:ubiquinone/menaquinone biosynthesis C-methylase UbiE/uncharacterized protein YbaR (Trm112 family)
MNKTNFDKTKIYENLNYTIEPDNYSGRIPWIVQQQIGATNGIHYLDRIGKLNDFPNFNLPIKPVNNGLMLDIGNGWGRWLVSGFKKGYIPIGIDIRLEFCKTAINTLHANNCLGYSLVADLKNLPFKDNVFDFVWSFSVIQHTHKSRMISCLNDINRILQTNGFSKLEFPNKNGVHNNVNNVKNEMQFANDINSWNVRYYSIKEYKKIFKTIFNNFSFKNHSFLGIGILKEDLFYVSLKNKIIVLISLSFSFLASIIPFLKFLSDSIFIKVFKNKVNFNFSNNQNAIANFLESHKKNPKNNLNIIHLLQCPISNEDLQLSDDKSYLISMKSKIKYPVIDGIPILIKSESF